MLTYKSYLVDLYLYIYIYIYEFKKANKKAIKKK